MSHADFLKDQIRVERYGSWWIELTITDPTGAPVTLRYARTAHREGTRNGFAQISLNGGADTIAAHAAFENRIQTVPTITQSMWKEGSILSSSLPTYSLFSIKNGDRRLDQYSPKEGYVWAGGRIKEYFFDATDIPGTIAKVFDGRLGQPRYSLNPVVEVPVYGREEDFNRKLSSRVYRGTSYMLELFGDRTVSFGTPAAVGLTGNMTIEGWFWLDAAPTTGRRVWGWGTGATFPWSFGITDTREVVMACTILGGLEFKVSAAKLTIQTPYHVSMVITGRDLRILLWDDDTQTLLTENYTNAFTSAARQAFTTGGGGSGYLLKSDGDATFRPWFDELRVWNYARADQEIADDRHRPLTSVPAACVHRLGCDDGTGTAVTDSSATAAHGTISGAGTSTWLWAQEGGAELAGTPKPDTIGHKFGMKPILVDPINKGYQAHWGSMKSVIAHEGGNPLITDATSASFRAYLVSAAPTAGHAQPYLAKGLFKLPAAVPVLPISATIEGANDGTAGYIESVSKVSRYFATERGRRLSDPSEIDTASYTTFQGGFDPSIGFTNYEANKTTIKQGMDLALQSAGGWWGFLQGSAGAGSDKLHVERYTGPAGVINFLYPTRTGLADQSQIVDIEELKNDIVIYEVEVRYHYNDVVHSEEQVAASVKGTTNWTQWIRPYLYKAFTDESLKAIYQGSSGKRLIVETAIYSDADAVTLGKALLPLVKGYKVGYRVTLRPSARSALLGQTEGLAFTLKNGMIVMGLDGGDRYVIVTTVDKTQEGLVIHEVMP